MNWSLTFTCLHLSGFYAAKRFEWRDLSSLGRVLFLPTEFQISFYIEVHWIEMPAFN